MARFNNLIARTPGALSQRTSAKMIGLVKDAMTSLKVGMKP